MNQPTPQARADKISMRIVDAVATVTDTDPMELDTPLYDVVDTDALDRLVEQDALNHVEFEYDDHIVTVDGDGTISVDGRSVPAIEA